MKNKAIFLDRDGTLIEDPGYLADPEKVFLLPTVGESLSLLKNDFHFKLIVVSNQSGIARGILTEKDVIAVNESINYKLSEFNVKIDAFYYCPFHPDFNSEKECECRKPSPKLIFEAADQGDINLNSSYLIGDSISDIEAGKRAGIKTILVKTGHGLDSIYMLQKENYFPTFVAENFFEASKFIINDIMGEIISAK